MRLRSALRGRGWRLAADVRRIAQRNGSSSSALAALGDPKRADVDAWNRATEVAHGEYRLAHPVPSGAVTIACVSMRPHLLEAVIASVARQRDVPVHVVFVANSPGFDLDLIASGFDDVAKCTVIDAPDGTSLGAALNLALDATDDRFVAKFDDDDLYSEHYLADALRAHGYAGAGIVGKHSYFTYIEETDSVFLRFPAHEFSYSGTLAGGSLLIDRDRVDDQRFDDISLGEDRAFIARCHRRGISTFAADRFNFAQVRSGTNTWQIPIDSFLEGAIAVPGLDSVEQ